MKWNRAQISWLAYDPGSSAYALLVRTIFAPIFFIVCARGAFANDATVTALWANAAMIAGIVAGFISILTGPYADARKRKKTALALFAGFGIFCCLAYLLCGPGDWKAVLAISFCGHLCFMAANTFYDSLLIDVAEPEKRNTLSSYGYALGYGGAILSSLPCLILSLCRPDAGSWVTKFAFALTACCWGLCLLPILIHVKEEGIPQKRVPFSATWKLLKENRNILRFLIAYFLYIDGVGTILLAATPLAKELQISDMWLLLTIVGLQFLGLPFTILYGALAKRFSARTMILWGIGTYMLITILVFVITFAASIPLKQGLFVLMAVMVGSAQGGLQALSRSFFSTIIPPERAAELFGIYNFFGKFTTIVGPVLMGLTTWLWEKATLGVSLMFFSFLAGAVLFAHVKPGTQDKTTV